MKSIDFSRKPNSVCSESVSRLKGMETDTFFLLSELLSPRPECISRLKGMETIRNYSSSPMFSQVRKVLSV